MSAGTLKLTNNSTAVVGTSTVFTTDLKPGDFITATIGGVLYTLPVDTVTSNTAATLVSPFTGPTTTGAAWAAVPRKVLSQVTADLVAQTTAAMRGMNNDKANWQSFYSAAGDINITLPDGTKVPGPSWAKMAGLVSSSQQWRGNLPAAANLNAYGPTPNFTGTWNRSSNTNTTAAYGFPEDNGQGILEVFAGGRYGGMQRYTVSMNGNVYVRSLTGAWNGADGPWSDWSPAGIQTRMSFFTGDLNTLKAPGEWSVTTPFSGGPTDVPGICEVIPRLNGTGLLQRYTAIATGAASINRTWQRTLSGTTWSGWDPVGIKPLNDLGIGVNTFTVMSSFDWQQMDFYTAANHLVIFSSMTNTPSGISYTAGTYVWVRVVGSNGQSISVELVASTSVDGNYKIYEVLIGGTKGARTFSVRQLFTSTDVVPVENGGTGRKTQPEALAALLGNSAVPVANGGTGRKTQPEALAALLGNSAVPVANGGTGRKTQPEALAALLGNSAVPVANGGTGKTTAAESLDALLESKPLPPARGGTGATTKEGARSALGVGWTTSTVNPGGGIFRVLNYDDSGMMTIIRRFSVTVAGMSAGGWDYNWSTELGVSFSVYPGISVNGAGGNSRQWDITTENVTGQAVGGYIFNNMKSPVTVWITVLATGIKA